MPKPKPKRRNERRRSGRHNLPLYVMLPPDELARLKAFAAKVARPLSWAVRDALRAYLDTVEVAADRLADLRAEVDAVTVDPRKAGRTKQPKRGRPRKGPKSPAADAEDLDLPKLTAEDEDLPPLLPPLDLPDLPPLDLRMSNKSPCRT